VLAPEPWPEQVATSRLLSRVRDDVMLPTGAKGQAYTALVTHRQQSQARLTPHQAVRLHAFLGGLASQASPTLRADLAWWQAHLSDFVGMTAWEIWQALPAVPGADQTLYLPLVLRSAP